MSNMKNKDVVEGADLLSSIAKVLFGGLEKALDYASEYEEEMGVLKQISRIPLHPEDDPSKTYTLTIKLSPIKDKNGKFYVEAETDAPNFNVNSINKKVMDLNKNNMKSFNEMIDKLIEENKMEGEKKSDQPAEETDKQSEQAQEEQSQESQATVERLAEEVSEKLESMEFTVRGKNGEDQVVDAKIRIDSELDPSNPVIHAVFSVVDNNGQLLDYPKDHFDFDLIVKRGQLSWAPFWNQVNDAVKEYTTNRHLELTDKRITGSTTIHAKFIKASEDIELTAIKASCNIQAALDTIDELAENDEFIDMIGEEPTSLEIVEDEEGFDVNPIDDVDTSDTYDILFDTVCSDALKVSAYKWAIGEPRWYKIRNVSEIDYKLNNIVPTLASWVYQHTDHCAVPKCFMDNGFEEVIQEGQIDEELVEGQIIAATDEALDALDGYYVNLTHDEQAKVDAWIQELKALLTF